MSARSDEDLVGVEIQLSPAAFEKLGAQASEIIDPILQPMAEMIVLDLSAALILPRPLPYMAMEIIGEHLLEAINEIQALAERVIAGEDPHEIYEAFKQNLATTPPPRPSSFEGFISSMDLDEL